MTAPLPITVMRKIQVDCSGCWLWTGYIDKYGYARQKRSYGSKASQKMYRVHRWTYEVFKGPIPEGLTIDHLCRVRHCVNPEHLEAVTLRENIRRGDHTSGGGRRRWTHCSHGHEFTPENTMRSQLGTRQCRECHRLRGRRYNQRKRERIVACRS